MRLSEAFIATCEKMEFEEAMTREQRANDMEGHLNMLKAMQCAMGIDQINVEAAASIITSLLAWHAVIITREGESGFDGSGAYKLNVGDDRKDLSDGQKLILAEKVVACIQAASTVRMMCEKIVGRSPAMERVAGGMSPAAAALDTMIDALMSCRTGEDLVSCLRKAPRIIDWGRERSLQAISEMMKDESEDEP